MDVVNKAKSKLVEMLISNSEYQSATELSDRLGVSARTVHIYLDELEETIKRYNLLLERKPGFGIKLIGKRRNIDKLMTFLKAQSKRDLEPSERQYIIFNRLLSGERLSYESLANDFFVSRSTIVKDIKRLKNLYDINSNEFAFNNEGTILVITERMRQSLWGKYFSDYYFYLYEVRPNDLFAYSQFIKNELKLNDNVVKRLVKVVESLGVKYQLADYYRLQLFENISLLYHRIKRDVHFEPRKGYIFERVTELETYYIAHDLASRLQDEFDLAFATEDILFLNECLIANGLRKEAMLETHSYFEQMAEELIIKISQIMNEDLTTDIQLKEGLLQHLVPMCFRLRNDIILTNPYVMEIKKQYSMMFHLTWYVAVDLEKELGSKLTEDEVGFLMIHFQSALERKRDIKKVLIISQRGLLTSEILERRIKRFLPSAHVYEIISEDKINEVDLSKVDLVISVVNHDFIGTPIIRISSIPTDSELEEISVKMDKILKLVGQRKDRSEHPLLHNLKKSLSIKRTNLATQKDVIDYLVDELFECGSVTAAYKCSVIQREKMSSTSFKAGIAIPHGNPVYVNETKVSILVNDKKINWGEDKVDVVVLISVSKADMEYISMIIERIYNIIESREEIERQLINQSDDDIYRYLARHK